MSCWPSGIQDLRLRPQLQSGHQVDLHPMAGQCKMIPKKTELWQSALFGFIAMFDAWDVWVNVELRHQLWVLGVREGEGGMLLACLCVCVHEVACVEQAGIVIRVQACIFARGCVCVCET